MRGIFLALAAVFCAANLAHAQGVVAHTQKIGKQVITDIQPLQPAKPIEIKPDVTPSATAVVMKVKRWNLGRFFVDDQGRRWRLVRGDSMTRYPTQLSGWRLITVDGEECFFTITGRLFTTE